MSIAYIAVIHGVPSALASPTRISAEIERLMKQFRTEKIFLQNIVLDPIDAKVMAGLFDCIITASDELD